MLVEVDRISGRLLRICSRRHFIRHFEKKGQVGEESESYLFRIEAIYLLSLCGGVSGGGGGQALTVRVHCRAHVHEHEHQLEHYIGII